MAGSFYNDKDSVDISELAALNDDISDDLIDHLQQQLTENFSNNDNTTPPVNENDDTTLFEDPVPATEPEEQNTIEEEKPQEEGAFPKAAEEEVNNENENPDNTTQEDVKKEKLEVNQSFDDNFIKKYKAKLQKKAQGKDIDNIKPVSYGGVAPTENGSSSSAADADSTPIEALSQGNITERPLTEDLKDYNDSLDFLDGNVKYSKYVIYIDPENVNFIEELTVKERKNLINRILRQQNDISITKQRFKFIQTIIRHVIILVLTIAITIPVVYHVINASLEATINNHRSAQTNWQALYREHGKISKN